jgi:hypothetical protein
MVVRRKLRWWHFTELKLWHFAAMLLLVLFPLVLALLVFGDPLVERESEMQGTVTSGCRPRPVYFDGNCDLPVRLANGFAITVNADASGSYSPGQKVQVVQFRSQILRRSEFHLASSKKP